MRRLIVLTIILDLIPVFALTDDIVVDLLVDLYTASYTGITEAEIFTAYGTTEDELNSYLDSLPPKRQDAIWERMEEGYYAFLDSRFEDFYGEPPALFEARKLGGGTYELELTGKVLFINVFATWCSPCHDEIPHFVELIEEYGGQFELVGVSMDSYTDVEMLEEFAGNLGINYPVVLYTQIGDEALDYYSVQSIPTTWVVNPEGLVQRVIIGSRPKEEFRELIDSYLVGH